MSTHSKSNSKKEVLRLLSELRNYAEVHNIANRQLASKLNIPYDTLRKWHFFTLKKDRCNPSESHMNTIREFLESIHKPDDRGKIEEAKRRTEKIKYILLLLEDELRWFRDNSATARVVFRQKLNESDIGYISSLMSMLTDEEKFERWLALTTIRFGFFRGR